MPRRELHSNRAAQIRNDRRWLQGQLARFLAVVILVGGIIFAAAAGGAFRHSPQVAGLPPQDYGSTKTGGILGLRIDAVGAIGYLLVLGALYTRRVVRRRPSHYENAAKSPGVEAD